MGRRKSHRELIEVLWESHYGTEKAPAARKEEPRPTRSRSEPPAQPAEDEEVDLERLEAGGWEEPAAAPDAVEPAPRSQPCTRRERRARSGPGRPSLRRWVARAGEARRVVVRSFKATTIGEFLGKTVAFRLGTLVVLLFGVLIFGLLCYLLGTSERLGGDELARYDERGLILPEAGLRPATYRNVETQPPGPPSPKTGAGAPRRAQKGTGGAARKGPGTRRAGGGGPPASSAPYWTIQVVSWKKKGADRDGALVESLRQFLQGLRLGPVWSESSGGAVTVYAGRYEEEKAAQADRVRVQGKRLSPHFPIPFKPLVLARNRRSSAAAGRRSP